MMLFLLAAFSLLQLPAGVGKAERQPPAPWVEVKADDRPITVLTAPDKSQWLLIDDGADLVASADGKTATFAATAKGRYRVVVVSPAGEPSRIVVVVGDAPKPLPPTPGPVDPVIPPADPLTAKLQAAYRLDTRADAAKAIDLKDLVELYKQAAEFAFKQTIDPKTMKPKDPVEYELASAGELVTRVRAASHMLGIEGLTDCRKAIADELKAAFPVDAAFDDASRLKAKVLFLKLSDALKAVK